MFLGKETLEAHSQLPKKAYISAAFGRLQAFRMYGGLSMSAPSLHRESTDSLKIPIIGYVFLLYTSVKIIKNEVGCRDDTVPKTVDTRRHCEEE